MQWTKFSCNDQGCNDRSYVSSRLKPKKNIFRSQRNMFSSEISDGFIKGEEAHFHASPNFHAVLSAASNTQESRSLFPVLFSRNIIFYHRVNATARSQFPSRSVESHYPSFAWIVRGPRYSSLPECREWKPRLRGNRFSFTIDRYEICRCTGMRMVKEKFHGFGYVASCKGHFFTMFCVFSSQEPYLHVSAELRK